MEILVQDWIAEMVVSARASGAVAAWPSDADPREELKEKRRLQRKAKRVRHRENHKRKHKEKRVKAAKALLGE